MSLHKFFLTFSLILLGMNTKSSAQNELDVIKNSWQIYNNAPNSLYNHLTAEAFEMLKTRAEKVSQINTINGWTQRQSIVRKKLWDVLGGIPEKTNLNAKITGTVKKKDYTVENIIYESLPGFYVTASLFIPDNMKKPAPAILFCSGHSSGVYRLFLYQQPLLNLVKKGFIVLAIDPIGQGERLQYFDSAKGESIIGSSTKEHSYPAAQIFLTGKSIARYFIWDGIRGIDYLVSRPEVDAKRIGVQGLSGGGTQTAYISALDERVAASAPAGYITSYRRLLESIGAADGEQNFYHGLSKGLDQADLLELRAPKPTLIMATTRDFFSIQGSRETYAEVKKEYELMGKPENIKLTEDDGGHGYTKKNREAMYAFFQKYLQLPGSSAEEEVECPTPLELQKTSTGQLSTSLGGETVFGLNSREAEKMISILNSSRTDLSKHIPKALKSAKILSGYREPSSNDDPVFTGRIQRDGYLIEKYFLKGEGDYVIPYLLIIPEKPTGKALIYLHPAGKAAEAASGQEIEWFVKKGFTVLAPDLIGIGEMGPGVFKGDAYISGFSYNIWFTSLIIGRSITGVQTGDVVRLSKQLGKTPGITDIHGFARKEMTPVLLHAAAFDQTVKSIALIEPYCSYQSIVSNRFYQPGFVQNLVAGALPAYDLPDLEASLAPRKLLMVGTTDGNGENTNPNSIDKDLDIVKTTYKQKNASQQLSIIQFLAKEKLYDELTNWLQ